ncbi:MAG: TetR/AcrR family transcriptional regulator [Persicimonas sp.]
MSTDESNRATRANGRATRERILIEATRLFADTGYQATSLRQIARAVGIDSATLKYHFGDKPRLFAEVYRRGHEAFLEALDPLLRRLHRVDDRDQLREVLEDFVVDMHDFVEENLPFVRLTLYRMLEDSEDVIALEEELQTVAIATLEQTFEGLIDRGVVRDVDARAFVVFIVSSFSTWQVTGRVKSRWLGDPPLDSRDGRSRSEDFFIDLVEAYLLEEDGSRRNLA